MLALDGLLLWFVWADDVLAVLALVLNGLNALLELTGTVSFVWVNLFAVHGLACTRLLWLVLRLCLRARV